MTKRELMNSWLKPLLTERPDWSEEERHEYEADPSIGEAIDWWSVSESETLPDEAVLLVLVKHALRVAYNKKSEHEIMADLLDMLSDSVKQKFHSAFITWMKQQKLD